MFNGKETLKLGVVGLLELFPTGVGVEMSLATDRLSSMETAFNMSKSNWLWLFSLLTIPPLTDESPRPRLPDETIELMDAPAPPCDSFTKGWSLEEPWLW
jgi:hypothetical protein